MIFQGLVSLDKFNKKRKNVQKQRQCLPKKNLTLSINSSSRLICGDFPKFCQILAFASERRFSKAQSFTQSLFREVKVGTYYFQELIDFQRFFNFALFGF